MASFTRDWDEANPTDNNYAYEIDEYNRYLRVDCSDRLKDMVYGFTAGENDGLPGFKKLTVKQQSAAAGTPNADEIVLYSIDDGTNCGLYGKNEDGYAKQILKKSGTSLILNVEAGDYTANSIDEDDIQLANDAYMTALDAAGTGTVNLIKAGTNDLPTLPDSSEMATNAAPTEDEGIANKKYVDDQDIDLIGAGVSKSKDTNYTAATSGTIVVMATITWTYNTDTFVTVLSDDNATPTTVVGKAGGKCMRADSANNIIYHTLTVPIIKSKKYRVEDTGATAVINSITFYPNQ